MPPLKNLWTILIVLVLEGCQTCPAVVPEIKDMPCEFLNGVSICGVASFKPSEMQGWITMPPATWGEFIDYVNTQKRFAETKCETN